MVLEAGAACRPRLVDHLLVQFVDLGGVPVGRRELVDKRQVEPEQQPRARPQLAELPRDDLGRLANDLLAAQAAIGPPDTGEQQSHVVMDFGRGADRRAGVADAVLLTDGNRRRDPLDLVDVGLLHALQELPRVGRQRLHVAPLPFGVDGVEGERRLARPAHAGDDDQLAHRQRDIDVLQVVSAGPSNDEIRGSGSRR